MEAPDQYLFIGLRGVFGINHPMVNTEKGGQWPTLYFTLINKYVHRIPHVVGYLWEKNNLAKVEVGNCR